MILFGTLFSSSVKMNTGRHFFIFQWKKFHAKRKLNKNNVISSQKCDSQKAKGIRQITWHT